MLDVFYGAFSPACFALLGLWLVIVQIRLREWQGSAVHRRRLYAVALHFALPGIMSLLALVDPHDSAFWRISFAIVALGGAIVLATVRGLPLRRSRRASPGAAGADAPARPDQLGLAAYIARHSDLRSYRGAGLYLWIGGTAHRGHTADPSAIPRIQRGVAAVVRRPLSLARAAAGPVSVTQTG